MNWKTIRLGEIAVEDRKIISPESAEAASRPYLGLDQIESGTGRVLSYESNSSEGKSTTFAFDETHVLYGKLRPYLNKVIAPDRRGRCSTEIIPLLPRDVDREFLAYLLRTDVIVDAAMSEKTGSRMPRADMNILLDLEVSIPESEQAQRQIAARLKAQLAEVETARQAAQVQLRDAGLLRRSVLQATFDELLNSYGRDVCLKNVCDISAGGTPSRGNAAFFTGYIPWVKTLDLNSGVVTDTEEKISLEALHAIRGELLPIGTVMVAMYGGAGTIGKSGILGIKACTNQAVCALQPYPNELDSDFLHEWLCYIRPEWMRLAGGNRKDPNINKAIVENMTLPIPPIDDQRLIVAHLKQQLAEVDTLRTALEHQQREFEALPQRILAQAFEN